MKILSWTIQTVIASVLAIALIGRWDVFLEWSDEASGPTESNPMVQEIADDSLQDTTIVSLQTTVLEIVESLSASIVSIQIQDTEGTTPPRRWWGSGFLVDRDGYIVTNRHVVDDDRQDYVIVFADGSTGEVGAIVFHPELDLALLQVAANTVPIGSLPIQWVLSDDQVQVGQFAVAFGKPAGVIDPAVRMGIVSSKQQTIDVWVDSDYSNLYQTDIAISEWWSWWPLLSLEWEVVGVMTALSRVDTAVSFAVPVDADLIDKMIESVKSE